MKKLMIFPMFVLAAATAVAQEAIPAETAERANAELKAPVRAKDLLADAFAQFAEEAGISYGEVTSDGRFYSRGDAPVEADYASAQFVKSRAMAYERAYVAAVSQAMLDFYGKTFTEKVAEYYGDNSSNAEESPVVKAKGVDAKLELLTDAKLDKALAAEGVDAEKYATASVIEKRVLLRDAMTVSSGAKALHASSGCVPVKTFEACGSDGRYYIGVVVRYDRTAKTLATCFKEKKRPAIVREGGLTVKEALPPKDQMLSNFGVRLYFDETGTPALLSFGQFGSSYTGKSARQAERAEEHALEQAKALADSGLTTFINSIADVLTESTTGEEIAETLEFSDDGSVKPESVVNAIDIRRKRSAIKGSDTMLGRSTVFEQVLTHPNGHRVAVVVRRWSFGTVDSVRQIDNPPKPPTPPEPPKVTPKDAPKPPVGPESPIVRPSRTYDF